MNKAVWGALSVVAMMALCGVGMATVRAQRATACKYRIMAQPSTADGRGAFPVGHDHHVGQFNFAVTLGHNGPEGSFEYNEKNVPGQNIQHILLHPVDHLTIQGHVAQFEGATLWHDGHARVRVIATDNGEHNDSLSLRVVGTDKTNAGKVLYEVGGILTTGAIHVYAH